VSPVRYELGYYIPEDRIFIVTTMKTSNLTYFVFLLVSLFVVLPKLVAETIVTKELGGHISAVMRQKLHNGQRLSDHFGVGP
jgi:hypothetical protein